MEGLLDHPDAEVRRVGVLEAADLGDVGLLVRAAADLDAGVRLEAVRALEGEGDPAAVMALLDHLDDVDEEVRAAAVQSLTELQDRAAGPLLLGRLGAARGEARAAILAALRKLRLAEVLTPAIAALADHLPTVRREAALVLAYLRAPEALVVLAERAIADPDSEVRRAAVGALGYGTGDGVVAPLLEALRDVDWQVREEAAVTLGKLGRGGADGLIAAVGDGYWQVAVKAAAALGVLKARGAVPALATALRHPVSNLRKEAAAALGAIADPEAGPALTEALGDPDIEVRKAASRALQMLGRGP